MGTVSGVRRPAATDPKLVPYRFDGTFHSGLRLFGGPIAALFRRPHLE
jgi:hypothetical protein